MECLGVPTDVLVEIFLEEKAVIEGLGDNVDAKLRERLALVSAVRFVLRLILMQN